MVRRRSRWAGLAALAAVLAAVSVAVGGAASVVTMNGAVMPPMSSVTAVVVAKLAAARTCTRTTSPAFTVAPGALVQGNAPMQ